MTPGQRERRIVGIAYGLLDGMEARIPENVPAHGVREAFLNPRAEWDPATLRRVERLTDGTRFEAVMRRDGVRRVLYDASRGWESKRATSDGDESDEGGNLAEQSFDPPFSQARP